MKIFALLVAAIVCALNAPAAVLQMQEFQGAELEQFLTQAKITQLKRIGQGVTNPEKATMELNGTTHFAVWKIIDEKKSGVTQMNRGIEIEFQDSWRTEVAAYEMDKILGLGMVPATVERSFNGRRGSLQFFVDSKMAEAERVKNKIQPPSPADWNYQMFKVRLFDNLIYNNDRHLNNLLITEDFKIRLIDHSRSFRPFAQLKEPKMLTRFSRSLLAKLKELNEPLLKERLGKHLSTFQIQSILKRRDAILKIADELVKQKGEAAVLYP
ncbi:MAG: hypothetical protein HY646_15670 [Acidobacteria bacterium]|nr:hypothetical protein [Acidobacteriota bacterium]